MCVCVYGRALFCAPNGPTRECTFGLGTALHVIQIPSARVVRGKSQIFLLERPTLCLFFTSVNIGALKQKQEREREKKITRKRGQNQRRKKQDKTTKARKERVPWRHRGKAQMQKQTQGGTRAKALLKGVRVEKLAPMPPMHARWIESVQRSVEVFTRARHTISRRQLRRQIIHFFSFGLRPADRCRGL